MKTVFKWLLISLAIVMVLVVLTPILLLNFAGDNTRTSLQMVLSVLMGYGVDSPTAAVVDERFQAPPGFSVNLFASDLKHIRFMAVTNAGHVLVSRPRQGDILLLEPDLNADGRADDQRVLLSGLDYPHGLDLHEGWLYIAERSAVKRIAFNAKAGAVSGLAQTIVSDLTANGNHWTKTIAAGPDGWMYLTAGSTCNVCVEEDPRRATMMRFKPDGTEFEIYARGLRNSVGFDWAPWDNSLYATDNGRDMLGDDYPPCELNNIVRDGFYGWPYINGFADLDPDIGSTASAEQIAKAISPVHAFRAHNAPLGIRFLRFQQTPAYKKTALVALHGSWNRSERDGYKVVALQWQTDPVSGEEYIVESDFLSGFKRGNNDIIGRPVDVIEASDGSIYVSDDYSGSIYRIRYGAETVASDAAASSEIASNSAEHAAVKPSQHIWSSDSQSGSSQSLDRPQNLTELLPVADRDRFYAMGRDLYQRYHCRNCHGDAENLQSGDRQQRVMGARVIRPLQDLADRYVLSELAAFFVAPTPPMPVYPLQEEERKALAYYLSVVTSTR